MFSWLVEQFGLGGRTALVTGGNSGIGRAIAGALASAGARVVVLGRDASTLAATVEELRGGGAAADWVSADLADRAALAAAADRAAGFYGEPDILVNSAGVNIRPPLASLTPEQWDALFAVNLTAPFLLGQRFGPGMAERGWGRIINLSSQQAVRAYADSGGYGATKGGLVSLTRSQAEAWSRHGVCCNAISPGVVHTPMNERLFSDPARAASFAARTMIGRNGVPDDFAGLAVFLASPASAYVTGQHIMLDGGFSAT
ncbi:SDR family oxidoreductase [Luedemannella helvata]|uniref:SDR family oxidoreductase n=1 Tax=Luedemannella helvata TaxID=349315 RepID=A0ABP4VUK1_9ACTN